jgi:hypothetical protein
MEARTSTRAGHNDHGIIFISSLVLRDTHLITRLPLSCGKFPFPSTPQDTVCLLRTSLSVRLERKRRSNSGHSDIQRSAEINRHTRRRISICSNNRRHNPHDPVTSHRDTVSSSTMSGGQDLRRISVQRPVVNIQTETDQAGKCHILSFCADLGVGEEEGHGEQGADHHGVFAAEKLQIRHVAC